MYKYYVFVDAEGNEYARFKSLRTVLPHTVYNYRGTHYYVEHIEYTKTPLNRVNGGVCTVTPRN